MYQQCGVNVSRSSVVLNHTLNRYSDDNNNYNQPVPPEEEYVPSSSLSLDVSFLDDHKEKSKKIFLHSSELRLESFSSLPFPLTEDDDSISDARHHNKDALTYYDNGISVASPSFSPHVRRSHDQAAGPSPSRSPKQKLKSNRVVTIIDRNHKIDIDDGVTEGSHPLFQFSPKVYILIFLSLLNFLLL